MTPKQAKDLLLEVFLPKQTFSAITNNKIAFSMQNFNTALEIAALSIAERTSLPLKGTIDCRVPAAKKGEVR